MDELAVLLRWLALGVSLASAALAKPHPGAAPADLAGAAALAALALARTLWPLRVGGDRTGASAEWRRPDAKRGKPPVAWKQTAAVVAELLVAAGVVGTTGTVDSPFLVFLAATCFVAGLVLPPALLGAAAVAVIGSLAAAGAEGAEPKPAAARAVEGVAVVAALALLGSYSEWLARKAREARDTEISRLRDMAEVNHLLLELHAKAASQPATLSLKAAVSGLASRLRQLLQPDVMVLLLAGRVGEDGTECWEVTLAEGVDLPQELGGATLAPALREAANSLGPVCRSGLGHGEGVAPGSWTGLYVPLWARDRLTGLLAVERVGPGTSFAGSELEVVEGLSSHAGLAIDNARWFRRLRALGAEEERNRLARELHDRVGQSLAYLALCLERLHSEASSGAGLLAHDLSTELGELAAEARKTVREVRTKLSDLRTEVVGSDGVASAIEGIVQRAEARSAIRATLSVGTLAPLEPRTAKEVVRIAEEAVHNAERHSGGTEVEVRLSWDGRAGMLVVSDNGRGMPAKAALRPDAFGILGMRERAEAIGGTLEIRPSAGKGTSVTLVWGERADRG
jgi:signal transduction histidine kinase